MNISLIPLIVILWEIITCGRELRCGRIPTPPPLGSRKKNSRWVTSWRTNLSNLPHKGVYQVPRRYWHPLKLRSLTLCLWGISHSQRNTVLCQLENSALWDTVLSCCCRLSGKNQPTNNPYIKSSKHIDGILDPCISSYFSQNVTQW